MNAPAEAPFFFDVEDLSCCHHAIAAANDNVPAPRAAVRRFFGRPLIAGFFSFLIFAPGCAAAAVFLMRTDGEIPPVTPPERNPPIVAKTDRLPVDMWGANAAEMLGVKETAQAAAAAIEDPAFLAPLLIRGSLDEGTLTTLADTVASAEPIVTAAIHRPRPKHEARRMKLAKLAIDAALVDLPAQPTLFEKLFGLLH